jgi:general secretion pathway protein D
LSIPRVIVSGNVQGGGGGGQGGGQGGQQGGQGLSGITTRTNNMEAVSAAVRQFFITLGVNLDPLEGKSVFFNDRKGVLLVRATLEELDIVEQVVQSLNVAPPQVNIKAKFTEINQNDNKALGFDWYLGNIIVGDKGALSGGTQPTYTGQPSTANPAGLFPGTSPATAIASAATDQLLSSSLRKTYGRDNTAIPALASFTGILTDPQFRVVIRAIEQRDGIDLLSEGEVTTLSGRQAQLQVVELRTIVTGVDQQQGQQGAAAATTGTGTVNQAPAATFVTPTTQILPFGPVLDVLPSVSADGYTVQMTIIPTLTEFVGYDLATASTFVPQAITGTGQTINSVLPLPILRLRQVTTSCIVWDGQTIVLGGLIADVVSRTKDKVPLLGDLPYLGRFFQSESSATQKKNLVIFVTPTIIDPAGNPAHSDEEMPFAQQVKVN